jgi:lysophospholipase L1-like esterase
MRPFKIPTHPGKAVPARFLCLGVACALAACQEGKNPESEVMDSNSNLKQEISALAKARIFFGHQSVGRNILDGLKSLAMEEGAALNILRPGETDSLPDSFLMHADVGENEKPQSKCDAMEAQLSKAPEPGYNLAMLKFCYVDFNRHTDVAEVFAAYKRTIAGLRERHPNTVFVHASVPLTSISVKDRATAPIKRLLGRPHPEGSNIKRNQYNRLLLEHFNGEPIFDIAKAESIRPDGGRETFKDGDETHYSLVNAYTDDGGHLNAAGARRLAREFVRVVSGALSTPVLPGGLSHRGE